MGLIESARGNDARPTAPVRRDNAEGTPPPPASPDAADRNRRARGGDAAPTRDVETGPRELGSRAPRSARDAAGPDAPRPPRTRPDDPTTRELSEQARRTRDGRRWDPDAPLSQGRNAHHSNTKEE